MSAPEDDSPYTEIVMAIERIRLLIEELEALPSSPKRDGALELLRERQSAAIRRLGQIT